MDVGVDVDGVDVDTDVSRFLEHLESERRLSPRTVVSYRKDLEDLGIFLDDHYGAGEWGWGTVGRIDFRAFMGWCGSKRLTRRTVARKLSAIRTFYRFLHLEDRVPSDPARTLRSPRVGKASSGTRDCGRYQGCLLGGRGPCGREYVSRHEESGHPRALVREWSPTVGTSRSRPFGPRFLGVDRPRCSVREARSDSYLSPGRRGGPSADTCLAASNSRRRR